MHDVVIADARRRYQTHPPADHGHNGHLANARGEGQAIADGSPVPPPGPAALDLVTADPDPSTPVPERDTEPDGPADEQPARPFQEDLDPVRRRKWFTAAQFAAFQVVQAGVGATSSWVIVDG
ncbi:hypothetical protein AB0K48_59525, partial [Nonomuraea sp. NPDC055795]